MTPHSPLALNETVQTIVFNIPPCPISCRSLWTILSTCFLTIFACVYTAVHHNVPSPYDRQLRLIIRAVWTIMLGMAVPELIVVWAARQRVSARYFTTEMKKWIADEKHSSEVEILIANNSGPGSVSSTQDVGGTVSSETQETDANGKEKMKTQTWIESWFFMTEEDESWTDSHSFYAYMGGFMIYHNGRPFSTITPRNLLQSLKDGHIEPVKLTKIEIDDCSKGNVISKGLVILQVAWFVIHLVARRMDKIAITPLEIGTVAFCVLCFVTYICWWNKPLSVQHPRRIEWKGSVTPPGDLHTDNTNQGGDQDFAMAPVRYVVRLLQKSNGNNTYRVETFGGDDIDYFNSPVFQGRNPSITFFVIGLSVTFTFGLVHLAAWNFDFPSVLEQATWRYCTVVLVCVPVCMILIAAVRKWPFGRKLKLFVSYFTNTIFFGIAFAYTVSRILLVILMLSTLRDLPPTAYKTVPWAEIIPHI